MQSKSRMQKRVFTGMQNPRPNSTKPNQDAQLIVLAKGEFLSEKDLKALVKDKKENPRAYESALRDMNKVYTKIIAHS